MKKREEIGQSIVPAQQSKRQNEQHTPRARDRLHGVSIVAHGARCDRAVWPSAVQAPAFFGDFFCIRLTPTKVKKKQKKLQHIVVIRIESSQAQVSIRRTAARKRR